MKILPLTFSDRAYNRRAFELSLALTFVKKAKAEITAPLQMDVYIIEYN
jgi:hypothetical protein